MNNLTVSQLPELVDQFPNIIGLDFLPVDKISLFKNGPHVDRGDKYLQEIADNIQKYGSYMLSVVQWQEEQDRYVIAFGEDQWNAYKIAGIKKMPCLILDPDLDINEESFLFIQLSENRYRRSLNHIEMSDIVAPLHNRNVKISVLAKLIGQKRSNLYHILNLQKLSGSIKDDLRTERMENPLHEITATRLLLEECSNAADQAKLWDKAKNSEGAVTAANMKKELSAYKGRNSSGHRVNGNNKSDYIVRDIKALNTKVEELLGSLEYDKEAQVAFRQRLKGNHKGTILDGLESSHNIIGKVVELIKRGDSK